jgi:hypothetical protein
MPAAAAASASVILRRGLGRDCEITDEMRGEAAELVERLRVRAEELVEEEHVAEALAGGELTQAGIDVLMARAPKQLKEGRSAALIMLVAERFAIHAGSLSAASSNPP